MRPRTLCLACALACAAQTATPLPEFEIATIKPVVPNVMHDAGTRVYPGGRLVIHTVSLEGLIFMAYRLPIRQIAGADGWMQKDEYDIEAKPPANLGSRVNLAHSFYSIEDESLREMLQALLVDRFNLKFHRETKQGQIYLLEKSAKMFRLVPVDSNAVASKSGEFRRFEVGFAGGRWFLFNVTMTQLAEHAGDYILNAPVSDRTGLTGAYDYKQRPPLSDAQANNTSMVDSFGDFLKEVGLQLHAAEGPVETLVIDHAGRPSPN